MEIKRVAIKVKDLCEGYVNESETDIDLRQRLLKACAVYVAVGIEHAATHGKERHRPVHGTSVYVYVAYLACQVFRHSALATRRVSVYGYHNLLHVCFV